MSPTNEAAWLTAPYARLEVKEAPYTPPGPNQLVVKNHFVAANPLDWAKQYIGDKRWPHLTHPCVVGADVAGEVIEVGSAVTRFKPGDRIIAQSLGFYDFGQGQPEAAFQRYTLTRDYMTTAIPDSLPFDKAVAVPLSCSAAASALFQKPFLALDHPTVPARPSNGRILIVTGGATAVGSNAIQLARYAGYTVATTCSPRNFDLMKQLGASPDLIFDYSDPGYEGSLAVALKGKKVAGAFALGKGAIEVCIRILGGLESDLATKIVVKASFPWPNKLPVGDEEYYEFMEWVEGWNKEIAGMEKEYGVETRFVEGAELARNEVGRMLYEEFLPKALAEGGGWVVGPEPLVAGRGLEGCQKALDRLREGVSVKKVVVDLEG